ncbi:MAG: hypothetical protein KTR31_11195 [Myxococcales bacterium]|nr:hypothetical protein [Myxococcales bacterium]
MVDDASDRWGGALAAALVDRIDVVVIRRVLRRMGGPALMAEVSWVLSLREVVDEAMQTVARRGRHQEFVHTVLQELMGEDASSVHDDHATLEQHREELLLRLAEWQRVGYCSRDYWTMLDASSSAIITALRSHQFGEARRLAQRVKQRLEDVACVYSAACASCSVGPHEAGQTCSNVYTNATSSNTSPKLPDTRRAQPLPRSREASWSRQPAVVVGSTTSMVGAPELRNQ